MLVLFFMYKPYLLKGNILVSHKIVSYREK